VREPNGWLRFDALPTRIGVFTYQNADGSLRRELRLPQHVFDTRALASFHMVPLTNDHPDEALTADNTAKYQRGSIGSDVRREGDFVRVSGLVTDAALVTAILAGKTELSCGYDCELVPTAGEWNGIKYDAVQTNIRGNHVAVVDRGRAGPSARINTDAAIMVSDKGDGAMETVKVTIGDLTMDVPKDQADQIRNMLNGGAGAQASMPMMTDTSKADRAALDRVTAERDEARRKLDTVFSKEAEAKRKQDALELRATVQREVRDRMALESQVVKLLGADYKTDGKSDRDLWLAVITNTDKSFKADGKSDDYVTARFDAVVENLDAGESGEPVIAKARRTVDSPDATRAKVDENARRDAMCKANREAHQNITVGIARK
jgi:hypothetical protein